MRTLLIILFLAPGGLLCAQAPLIDTLPVTGLPETVVTAARRPTPALTSAEAIDLLPAFRWQEAGSRTTPEALMALPGVWVQKTNHGGGSPFLRGLTGNQALFLVDGIRLNNAAFRYGPNQYFNTIDLFTLDRIEVMRGSGSVLYGSDALGGVVQVLTRGPMLAADLSSVESAGWHGAALGQFQSQGMEQGGRAELEYRGRRMGLLGGLTYRDFGDLRGGGGFQRPSGYDERAFDAKGIFELSKKLRLTLAHQYLRQDDVPVYHKIQLENFARNHMAEQRRELSYARLEWNGGRPWVQNVQLTLSRHFSDERRESRKNNSAVEVLEQDRVESLGASVAAVHIFRKNWTATSGLELYRDGVNSSRTDQNTQTGENLTKRGLYPDASTYLNAAAYTLHELQLGRRWRFTGGLRWNAFVIELDDPALGAVRLTPSALVGQASALYAWPGGISVFAAYHGGFRAPNIDDLGSLGIVDFRYETPNYALRPERSHSAQLGAKAARGPWQAELYVFRQQLTDLILRNRVPGDSIAGYPVYQKENAGQAYLHGLEASARRRLNDLLTLEASGAWVYGQNTSAREPLRRMPPLNGRLALEMRRNAWFAALETQAAAAQKRLADGDKKDNRIGPDGTPGWWALHLAAGYQTRRLGLHAGLRNLLDRDYRLHGSGIDAAGRSAWVRGTWRF